jgi:hypothetical protein
MEAGTSAHSDDVHLAKYKLDITSQFKTSERESQEKDVVGCLNNDQDGFFYISNFINEQEEEYLIEKVRYNPRLVLDVLCS